MEGVIVPEFLSAECGFGHKIFGATGPETMKSC